MSEMAIKLELTEVSVRDGYTIWKDELGRKWKLKAGIGKTFSKIAATDPLVVRVEYGLPSNFYWRSGHGNMEIAPEMLYRYAEEVKE